MTPTVLGMLFTGTHVAVGLVTWFVAHKSGVTSVVNQVAAINADLKAKDLPKLLTDFQAAMATIDELRRTLPAPAAKS